MLLELWQRGVLYYFIPQVGQVVFTQVSVKERVIHLDVHGFLVCSGSPLCFPVNYGEAFQICLMSCDLTV